MPRALRRALLVVKTDVRIYQQRLQHRRIDQPAQAIDHRFGQKILLRNLLERILAERRCVRPREEFGVGQGQFE